MPTDRTNTERQREFRKRQREARTNAIAAGAPPAPAIPTFQATARWTVLHDQARAAIQTMLDEMEAYRDDRSEAWQESNRAEKFEEKIEAATELRDALDSFSLN